MPDVRRQARRETEASNAPTRFLGAREEDGLVERQRLKRVGCDFQSRLETADDFRLERIALARDEYDGIFSRANRWIETGDPVGDEDVAGKLGIDATRAGRAGEKMVRFVEHDLVRESGPPPECRQQGQDRVEIL